MQFYLTQVSNMIRTKVSGKVISLNLFSLTGIYIYIYIYIYIPISVALLPNAGHDLLILEVTRSHTTTHHSRYDSSGRVISSSQRPLPDNTQHSQHTNIHAPGGLRTHDLSRRAAVNLRLRPRGHWYRLTGICISPKQKLVLFKQLLLNTITSTHFCQRSGSFTSSSRRNCGSRWWHVVGAVVTSPDKKWHRLSCWKKRKSYGAKSGVCLCVCVCVCGLLSKPRICSFLFRNFNFAISVSYRMLFRGLPPHYDPVWGVRWRSTPSTALLVNQSDIYGIRTHKRTAHRYWCLLRVPTSRHAQVSSTDIYSNSPQADTHSPPVPMSTQSPHYQTRTAHQYWYLLKVPNSRDAQAHRNCCLVEVPTSRHAQPTGTDIHSNVPTRRQLSIGRNLLLSNFQLLHAVHLALTWSFYLCQPHYCNRQKHATS